jgi:hypothetical protein
MRRFLFLLFLTFAVESMNGHAFALEPVGSPTAKPVSPAQTAKPPKQSSGTVTPALSGAQCRGLGGSVVPEGKCTSAFACSTVDVNGTIHEGCINEADK